MKPDVEILMIDRAAVAVLPDRSDLQAWTARTRVFVSSVMDDYENYRRAAAEAIRGVGATPVMFETFGGMDSGAHEAYIAEVSGCDIYVGLLGAKYGRLLPSRFSATHEEYRAAERLGLRLSVWVETDVEPDGNQRAFIDDIQAFDVTGQYSDESDLSENLAARLERIAAEEMSPWCKLGNVVFRAAEIVERADRVTVRTDVKDPEIVERLREMAHRLPDKTNIVTPTQVKRVRDVEIETTTSMTGGMRAELSLTIADTSEPMLFSTSSSSVNDLTGIALRSGLLGEVPPVGLMNPVVDPINPLTSLAAAMPPEEAVRPIARLLLFESLVIDRGAGRLARFRLGRAINGERLIDLVWVPGSRNGEREEQVTVNGYVRF